MQLNSADPSQSIIIVAPGAYRREERLDVHIHQALPLKPLTILVAINPLVPRLLPYLGDEAQPADRGAVGRGLGVREREREGRVLDLEDAAGGEGVDGGADDAARVPEAGEDGARVDVVEALPGSEQPVVLGVVDEEAAVGRDVRGLDW